MKAEKMNPLQRRFIRWMEDNRGLILTVIGLPASFIFDLIMQVNIMTSRNMAIEREFC